MYAYCNRKEVDLTFWKTDGKMVRCISLEIYYENIEDEGKIITNKF